MYIYIHIPFCNSICSYCDFAKLYYNKDYVDKYLDALENEIRLYYKDEVVKTIYIGGGTPTSLDYNELKRLLDITNIFNKSSNTEFSIESNVELSIDKIKLLKDYNVNRISLGVQSFDNNILNILNRTHNIDDVITTINNLKDNGFSNINIDLIYGVTNDIDIVKKDINTFLTLDIKHISCYSLIIEDNTMLKINKFKEIDENIEYEMYKEIEKTLADNNYEHYEVSNYCKEGYQSIHNLNYWNNGSYLGFGLGSVSFIDNYRITNTRNIRKYINLDYNKKYEYEDEDTSINTYIMLGLRKCDGINLDEFRRLFNKDISEVLDYKDYLSNNILIIHNGFLKINKNYIYLSNEILINILK